MRRFCPALALVISLLPVRAPAAATPDPIGQDLAATIALHGQPCDKVVNSQRNGDSDYTATCRDGSRYHVFVDARGRVIVQKLAR